MSTPPQVTAVLLKEYVEQPHTILLEGLAALPAESLSGIQRYIRDISCLISEITEGYLTLRNANKITASRVLIRPCIEAAMKLAAVKEDPNNLLNIAYTETIGDICLLEGYRDLAKEWLAEGQSGVGPETVENAENFIAERKQRQAVIRAQLGKQFPDAPEKDKYLKPYMLAKAGRQDELYGGSYVLYCNFVHATLRAINQWPEEMHEQDNLAVAKCLRIALLGIESIGGPTIPQHLTAMWDALRFN